MESGTKPRLTVAKVADDDPAKAAAAMFFALTGRRPTEDEMAEVREVLKVNQGARAK